VTKSEKTFSVIAVFSIIAALAYALYVYATTGSLPFVGGLGGIVSGKLSQSQIQEYASNAGFSGDDLNTAVAIAMAESSGNPSAVGDLNITPGGSIGLWQVNLKAHPEYTAAQLTDPQTNANAAFAIYSAAGSAFTPWSTYNSGVYKQYLAAPPSQDEVASAAPAPGDQMLGSTPSAVSDGTTPDSVGYGDDNEDV
jgi:hypothetical protein